jgi:hypothetical protein
MLSVNLINVLYPTLLLFPKDENADRKYLTDKLHAPEDDEEEEKFHDKQQRAYLNHHKR